LSYPAINVSILTNYIKKSIAKKIKKPFFIIWHLRKIKLLV